MIEFIEMKTYSFMRNYSLIILAVLCCLQVQAQKWEQLSDVPFSARHHAIGFAYEGYGYVLTGSNNSDVWKYTAATDTWEDLGDYPGPGRGYGIGDEMDGKLYFGFGNFSLLGGERFNDLWVFDPVDESFEELPECPCKGRTHPAMIALNGFVYVGMGGGDLDDWWAYDVENRTWAQKASLPAEGRHHPYQFKIGDYIYVGSGHFYDWYRYDPSSDTWTQIADLTDIERVAGTQFNYNGKGYVLSGLGNPNDVDRNRHDRFETGEFWEYDPFQDNWKQLPPHPGRSRWAPASFIIDGHIHLVSGTTDDDNDLTHFRFPIDQMTTSITDKGSKKDGYDLLKNVHPNPFYDEILLSWAEPRSSTGTMVDIDVFDMRLRHVVSLKNIDVRSSVDLSTLSKGSYLLQATSDLGISRTRIVKLGGSKN